MSSTTNKPKPSTTKPTLPEKTTTNTRVYKGQSELDHDLYKLAPAVMKKNQAVDGHQPMYVPLEHCHIFHSIDSNGKVQTSCNAIGGHFHEMNKVGESDDGVAVYNTGPPVTWAWKKELNANGMPVKKKITVPAKDLNDEHTHEVLYQWSEKIKPRKMNTEFIKYQGSAIRQQQTIKDVTER